MSEQTVRQWREKPVVIEAVQWGGTRTVGDPPQWLLDAINVPGAPDTTPGAVKRIGSELHIGTLEGVHRASPGDWIIRGVQGEIYSYKPDIFEVTYDPAT